MRKINIGDVLIWLGALIILTWALLKAFGVINTPVWVEMIPYVGGVFSVVGVGYYLGKVMERFNRVENKMGGFSRMRDDFISVRDKQRMCLSGELNGSPYSERGL